MAFQLEPHIRLNQPADEVRSFVLSDFADLLASQAASACVCRRLYWAGVSPEVPNFHIPRRSALNSKNYVNINGKRSKMCTWLQLRCAESHFYPICRTQRRLVRMLSPIQLSAFPARGFCQMR